MIQDHVHIVKHLPFFGSLIKKVEKETSSIADFYLKQIQIHREMINFEVDDEPTDYVEAFLRQQHKLEQTGQKNHTFTYVSQRFQK